jgi:hypothetical protein
MTDLRSAAAPAVAERVPAAPDPIDDADMRLVGQIALILLKHGNVRGGELAHRLWRSRSDRVAIDLPPCDDLPGVAVAHAAVIRLAAAGRLDLRQAQLLSRLLLNQGRAVRRTLEFDGFANRIEQIDAANRAQEADAGSKRAEGDATSPGTAKPARDAAASPRGRGAHPASRPPSAMTAPVAHAPCRPLPEPGHYPYAMAAAIDSLAVTAPPPD